MPFLIRSYRRFPVPCAVSYSSDPFTGLFNCLILFYGRLAPIE
jgi:hypothetical protein